MTGRSFLPVALEACLALIGLVLPLSAQLPPSKGAPSVGQKAPDFTLRDTNEKPVRLFDLLYMPAAGASDAQKKGSWVLLIFYRGYW